MVMDMEKRYVIGVDGGNTKADYYLFDIDGHYIDSLRDTTCSHEVVGYEAAQSIMQARIGELLHRNGLEMRLVAAGAFGLAGIDNSDQHERFEQIMRDIGFNNFIVDNDSFLGIIAGTSKGYGVCSINGTGTVSGGVDPHGNRLQVGGIGPLTGDDAGGRHIAQCGARRVYDSFYRCGEPTVMSEPVFDMLGIVKPEQLMIAFGEYEHLLYSTEMTRIVFAAAGIGDGPALEVLDESALQLAKTSAGCVRNLRFDKDVEVVLAGSVWVKAECPALFESYKKYMRHFLPDKGLSYNILSVPPAAGAVLWALSLTGQDPFTPVIRGHVTRAVDRYV